MKTDNQSENQEGIRSALERFAGHSLSDEEFKQACTNLKTFFAMLSEWSTKSSEENSSNTQKEKE